MTAWLGLIGAISGTAIGGIIAYFTAAQKLKHERKLDQHKRLIESFESIHELLSKVAEGASILNMGVLGELGYGRRLKGDLVKEKIPHDRLRMLVDFYAPSIREEVKLLSDQLNIIVRCATEVILQNDHTDEWKGEMVEKSSLASAQAVKLSQQAQGKLAELAHSVFGPG